MNEEEKEVEKEERGEQEERLDQPPNVVLI